MPENVNWRLEESKIKSHDEKVSLNAYVWRKREPNTGNALFIVHGFGEYMGRYDHLTSYLSESIDAIYGIDLRGHGKSEGKRGHIEDFDNFQRDVVSSIQKLVREPKLNFLGHSMGGLIALRLLFLHPEIKFKSVVISAPFLAAVNVPKIKKAAAILLSYLAPSIQLSTNLDSNLLTHDSACCEKSRNNPLVHDLMTPAMFRSLSQKQADTISRTSGISIPMKFIIPLDDRIVDTKVTLDFYQKLLSERKTISTYEGFYHESLNEIGKEKVFNEINEWIKTYENS